MQLAQETAIVSFIKDNYAYLKTASTSSCSKCSAQSSCGSLSFIKRPDSHLRVENTLNLKPGDSVVIGLATDKLLLGSVLMYLLPLFSLFIFAAIGKNIGGELLSIGVGLSGLLGSLLLVKKFVKKSKIANHFKPKLIRKVIGINVVGSAIN